MTERERAEANETGEPPSGPSPPAVDGQETEERESIRVARGTSRVPDVEST